MTGESHIPPDKYLGDDWWTVRRLRADCPRGSCYSPRARGRAGATRCRRPTSGAKGGWEAAVTGAAAGRCGDGTASLNRDSFSMSKIWMVPAAKREEDGRRTAESAGERRAASFRWPAMAAGLRKHRGGGGGAEASCDVEAAGGRGDNGAPDPAENRPSLARAAMLWVAGGRQGSQS